MGNAARLDNLKAQRNAAGHSITRLAQLSNTSDLTIRQLENGGTCTHPVADRILNALGISRVTGGFTE